MPLSDRGIGDDGLYAYGGYKVFDGEDPSKIVYDKPALGISLIGLFGYYLNNPFFSGLFFGLGSIVLLYFIVYKITKKVLYGLLTSTFLLLDPLFFQNLATSALDLPQLFFLLANILCLLVFRDKKKHYLFFVFLAGLFLGIFAQIKIPVMYPVIFLLEILLLYKFYGKSMVGVFLLGNVFSVVAGYLPYFFNGYSFIEFVNIQKFILAFYRDSNVPLHAETIWQFLFLGSIPGLASGVPSKVAEWSFVYPIATVLGVIFAVKTLFLKKEEYFSKGFAVILLFSLIVFTFIPSFPRYLILVLPFLYYFMVKALFIKGIRLGSVIVLPLLVYSLINTFYYFHPSPSSFLSYFYNNFTHQYFQDIYQEHIDTNTKLQFKRDEFEAISKRIFTDAKIKKIEITEEPYAYSRFDNNVSIPVNITYKTEYLGEFSEEKTIQLIRENAKWKVSWQWDYLLNEYDTNTTVESERINGKRGKIIDENGKLVVQDEQGYLVSFNPELMDGDQEKDMLTLFSKLSFIPELDLQNKYLENPPANAYVPLFTTSKVLNQDEINELLSYKGVKLEEYPTRIYYQGDPKMITNTFFHECCTRIYSSHNYHGTSGLESDYEKQLSGYDGGMLLIRNEDGTIKRVIIDKDKKDGEEVVLP